MLRFILLLVTISTFISCNSSKEIKTPTFANKLVAFTVLSSGDNGRFNERTNKLITDNNSFIKVWEDAYANFSAKKELPKIDFEKQTVILVAQGEKTSGGYSIILKSITELKNTLEVVVLLKSPKEGCLTTSVITYPYQIIVFDKPLKEVVFNSKSEKYPCK